MVLCCYESSSSSSSSSSSADESRAYNVQATVTHKRKAGRKKFRETRHPIYRCVRERNGNKWVCEVREPNKKNSRIWLGTYSTPEMAARAYDVAALALRGDSAPLNFPDSAWLLPRPNSSAIKDIQATASEAAQAFAPTSTKINFSASSSSTSSSSTTFVKLQHVKTLKELSEIFWDDEAFFNTPILLDSMAEGLLLTPPSMQENSFDWNEVDWNMDFSLWSN